MPHNRITHADELPYDNATSGLTADEVQAAIDEVAASSGGTDADAIHDNVSGEIAAVTEKTTPVSADLLLIEDSAASNAKKRVQVGNLPGGTTDSDAIHDNVAGEISALTLVTAASGDHVLIEDASDSNAKKRVAASDFLGGGGGGTTGYLHVRDEKTSGTNGGGSSAATWNVRTLNTSKNNSITGASLSSNQVTLPAGTFDIVAVAPCYRTHYTRLRLYDVSGAASLLLGPSHYASPTDPSDFTSDLRGRIVLASSTTVELQHYTTNAVANIGLGTAAGNSAGFTEVYSELQVWQVA